ncbi:MAG TPA: HAMP domain-containing protein [Acidobacteriota bacterium]|nr:HAMP domain-containing protein [Acidobacteriota bacterium]
MKKTLFIKTFLGYAAVIVILAFGVVLFAPPLMRTHHIEERSAELEHLAHLLEGEIVPFVTGAGTGDLEALVTGIGTKTGTRITVIGADGTVLADSEREPRDMENHLFRPEIQAALRGEIQRSIRPSSTLKAEMMYMSVPLRAGGRVVGALRMSLFMKDIEALLDALRNDLLEVIGVATVVALALALFLARSVTGPIREAVVAAKRVAAGDLDVKVSERRSGEFRDFARGFNDMTGRLKQTFAECQVQNDEIKTILASIREGLCVIDGDARIVLCNQAFRRMAGDDAPEGRHLWEVVRSSSLTEVVRKVRETHVDTSEEVTIGARAYLCSVIRLAAGGRLVLTLRDITEYQAKGRS